MWHWALGIFPVETDVDESDQEERPPEDDVGQGDDDEHLDVLDSLLLELYHVTLHLLELGRGHLGVLQLNIYNIINIPQLSPVCPNRRWQTLYFLKSGKTLKSNNNNENKDIQWATGQLYQKTREQEALFILSFIPSDIISLSHYISTN